MRGVAIFRVNCFCSINPGRWPRNPAELFSPPIMTSPNPITFPGELDEPFLPKESEIEQLKRDLDKALRREEQTKETLDSFRKAVQLLTQQMKYTPATKQEMNKAGIDNQVDECLLFSSLNASHDQKSLTIIDDDDWNLSRIMAKHSGEVAADLMNLQNSIKMLQDHVLLALDEASLSQEAQVDCERWKEMATETESKNRDLVVEKEELMSRLAKMTSERQVLKKECRSMHKRITEAEEKFTTQQAQNDVVQALVAHENQLARNAEKCVGDMRHHQLDASLISNRDYTDNALGMYDEKKTDEEPEQLSEAVLQSKPRPLTVSHGSLGFGGASVGMAFGMKVRNIKAKMQEHANSCHTSPVALSHSQGGYQPLRFVPKPLSEETVISETVSVSAALPVADPIRRQAHPLLHLSGLHDGETGNLRIRSVDR